MKIHFLSLVALAHITTVYGPVDQFILPEQTFRKSSLWLVNAFEQPLVADSILLLRYFNLHFTPKQKKKPFDHQGPALQWYTATIIKAQRVACLMSGNSWELDWTITHGSGTMGVAVVGGLGGWGVGGVAIKARCETQICGIQAHGNLIKNTVRKKPRAAYSWVSRSECKAREPVNMHLAELEI